MNKLIVTIQTLEKARDGAIVMNANQMKSIENAIHIMKSAQTKLINQQKQARIKNK